MAGSTYSPVPRAEAALTPPPRVRNRPRPVLNKTDYETSRPEKTRFMLFFDGGSFTREKLLHPSGRSEVSLGIYTNIEHKGLGLFKAGFIIAER